ncbi:MAG TPA: peptidase T [Candidatus Krumholzibacteria bacterium]|nr:peptidase T [Candidatus Krumholzibacteria bacterium]
MNTAKESVLDRFLRYVKIDTRSDEDSKTFPSTDKQWDLLRLLHEELIGLGLKDTSIDENGYVFATVPSNLPPEHAMKVPVIGFIAHVDTSPAVTGTNVRPVVHRNYQGGDIVLPGDPTQVIHASEYPNLEKMYIGMDIVTSDGKTLLGADDKAGVAEIMTAVEMFLRNPDIPRGVIKVGFTPDEEIGKGADHFDVKRFGADFAYTMDGGPLGEIEYESFNADAATLTIEGVGVHPGYAKNKLVNAIRILGDVLTRLPRELSPEMTEKREGYIHPYVLEGASEAVKLRILLRDFDMKGIEQQRDLLNGIAAEVQKMHPKARIAVEFKEYYRNMRYQIEKEPRLIAYAEEAITRAGAKPNHAIIRGGTDGSRLSYMGLPCPNLFAGGEAFHSTREWVPVQVMEKAAETIVRLAEIWAERSATKQ